MKLNRLEVICLVAFFLLLTWAAAADGQQQSLSQQMIRLHVIANSDSAEDQALKLTVRDAVLERAQPLLSQSVSREESREILQQNLQQLVDLAQQTVYDQGYAYPVRARYVYDYFPTKDYGAFSLPAGWYEGLRLEIGQGAGENWWCIVFPPLCTAAAAEPLEEDGLGDAARDFITQDEPVYQWRFKTVDLLNRFRHWLGQIG